MATWRRIPEAARASDHGRRDPSPSSPQAIVVRRASPRDTAPVGPETAVLDAETQPPITQEHINEMVRESRIEDRREQARAHHVQSDRQKRYAAAQMLAPGAWGTMRLTGDELAWAVAVYAGKGTRLVPIEIVPFLSGRTQRDVSGEGLPPADAYDWQPDTNVFVNRADGTYLPSDVFIKTYYLPTTHGAARSVSPMRTLTRSSFASTWL